MLRSVALAVLLALAVVSASQPPVLAAEPVPSPSPAASPVLIDPLDPRAGEGASSSGAPLLAMLVVIGLGIGASAATLAYVRLVRRR